MATAPATAGVPQRVEDATRGRSAYKAKYAYENLDGDDFLETPWMPPSKDRAKAFMRKHMYRGGQASLCTRISSLDFLGSGTGLYFRLIKYLAVTFFFMSVLAIPAIVITRAGNRVAEEDVDPLSLNLYSLANVGNPELPECEDVATQALLEDPAACNSTIITVLGRDYEAADISLIISISDFAYSLLFMLFMWFLKNRFAYVIRVAEKDIVTISDYAVFVKNLPQDATTQEIREHFSKLYNLNSRDWTFGGYCCGCKSRKSKVRQTEDHALRYNIEMAERLQGAVVDANQTALIENGPVEDVSNTRDFAYRGSWVAEVVMAHPNGALMRKYQEQKARLGRIRIIKAMMKKYNKGNLTASNRKFKSASKKLAKLKAELHEFDFKHAVRLSDRCVGAFVTFNCEDSRRFCLEDYEKSTSGWGRYWQAQPLMFRGNIPLEVTKAVEPSDVIWENIETTRKQRCCRQFVVYAFMFVLILASVVAMAFAQNKKTEFEDQIPNLDICDVELPTLAYEGFVGRTVDYSTVPDDASFGLNETYPCPTDTDLNLFNIFMDSPTDGVAAFPDGWNCGGVDNVEPVGGINCVSPDSSENCETNSGVIFRRSSVVGCYCLDALNQFVDEHGVFAGPAKLIDQQGDVCLDFAVNYTLAQALLLFAAAMVVFTNTALKIVLRRVTRYERHDTFTAQEHAIAIKVFLAQFLNTGLVVLIVNAKISSGLPDEVGVFAGEFKSFSPEWYSVVGVSIVITMLINIFAPHFLPVFHMMRACCKRTNKGFRKLVTQEQADEMYRPRRFLLSTRFPVIMNTVFVTMAYSSGLPILLPVCFLSLTISFWVDKITLLRLYGKPPYMEEDLPVFAQKLMPFALFLHLGISIWMYGDPDTLVSDSVDLGNEEWEREYQKWVSGEGSKYDTIELVPKLLRQNVFPIAALMFGFIFFHTVYRFFGRPVKRFIHKLLYFLMCCCCCKHDLPPPKHHHPRWTGPFTLRLGQFDSGVLTKKEHSKGWRIVDDQTRGGGAKAKLKIWLDSGTSFGIPHVKGQTKNTWEVVAEDHIPTFAPIVNPHYTGIITSLLDGTDKVHGLAQNTFGSGRWDANEVKVLQQQAKAELAIEEAGGVAARYASPAARYAAPAAASHTQVEMVPQYGAPPQGQGQHPPQGQVHPAQHPPQGYAQHPPQGYAHQHPPQGYAQHPPHGHGQHVHPAQHPPQGYAQHPSQGQVIHPQHHPAVHHPPPPQSPAPEGPYGGYGAPLGGPPPPATASPVQHQPSPAPAPPPAPAPAGPYGGYGAPLGASQPSPMPAGYSRPVTPQGITVQHHAGTPLVMTDATHVVSTSPHGTGGEAKGFPSPPGTPVM